jgi:hypothetical protein
MLARGAYSQLKKMHAAFAVVPLPGIDEELAQF